MKKIILSVVVLLSVAASAQKVYYLSSYLKKDGDNSRILNKVIAKAKDGDVLKFPNGNFYFTDTTIVQTNKGLNWEGSYNTNLLFIHPGTALVITRSFSTSKTKIENINFLSRYNGNSDTQHCMIISAPIVLKDFTIENFHGDGIRLVADVFTRPGTDASFSKVEDITIKSCWGHGIYLAGGDANAGTFIHCDIRDNHGIGIWDASFLGNNFFGCMTHNNWKGSFSASDANSRSNFFGCYCEGGQVPVYLNGAACWFGGLPSDGIELHGVAQVFSYPTVKIIK